MQDIRASSHRLEICPATTRRLPRSRMHSMASSIAEIERRNQLSPLMG